ncbi:MAG: nucleotidyltransferase domain-containing protein [bacterium]
MNEYLSFKQNQRQKIIEKIKQSLLNKNEIVFAFIFGSFLDGPSFRDIDIGIYLDNIEKGDIFNSELELSEIVAKDSNLLFDIIEIKVLNFAPGYFLNNIFNRGQLLFCKNYQLLTEMIENTSLDTLANEYIAYQSLKELVAG